MDICERTMKSTAIKTVLIVGGGVAGASLAILLRRRGVMVDLIEADLNWNGQGAFITITGPTLRAFRKVGILDEFFAYGAGWSGGYVFDKQGRLLEEMHTLPLEHGVPATAGIHRADLHNILSKRVMDSGANVRLGVTVDDVSQDADKVHATFSDASQSDYDLVVGADGVFSKLRQRLLPESGEPQYTGQACWRIVAEMPEGMDRSMMYMAENGKIGFNPISKTQMYMFLLEYAPSDPWREEEELPQLLYDLMEGYGGIVPYVRANVRTNSSINYRPLKGGVVPRPWKAGRVVFVGDAVHGPTPHLASGAGMAVEDTVVLDEELQKHADIHDALQAYEDRRFERCKFIVSSSIKLGQMEVAGADPHEHTKLMQSAIDALREPI
jgi:2-polyprenyl-6-methoxyphenol hydroxylase-like FAD-dependent oxidoreductase